MTFLSAPLALDGARTPAALIRKGTYADTSGVEGIVERADLKVTPGPGGVGLTIAPGNALVLNRYDTSLKESYVVSNPTTHTVLSTEMPTSQPSAKSYLVLVSIGDPEFSAVGHPWMTSDPLDPEEAVSFQYVRPWLFEVPAGTTVFSGGFPAYPIARVDIPANTTNILSGYITDLRKMARPRSSEELRINATGFTANSLNTVTPSWEAFGQTEVIDIPAWATRAKVVIDTEGFIVTKAGVGSYRVNIVGGNAGPNIAWNTGSAPGNDRFGFHVAADIDVSSIAGTTKTFRLEGRTATSASNDAVQVDGSGTSTMRVRFEESPI